MWDSSQSSSRWRLWRLVLFSLLGIGVMLGVMAYLFWRPDVSAMISLVAAQPTARGTVDSAGAAAESTITATLSTSLTPVLPLSITAGLLLTTPHDINDMIEQLQAMQDNLQVMANQLNQQPPSAATPAAEVNIVATLAEIARLNQVMQPLMQQIEVAVQSSRPESELAAMRTQMAEIHRQLTMLMAAVEVARSTTPGALIVTSPITRQVIQSTPVDPNQAQYEQLQQTLLRLKSMLQQLQSDPTLKTP